MARRGNRRPQDHFGHRARKEGYPARSVYKLQEIDRRVRLFRRGPARARSRRRARLVEPVRRRARRPERPRARHRPAGDHDRRARRTLRFVQLDLDDRRRPSSSRRTRLFDVVLSDMAPRTSGQRHRDQYLSFELYMRALELAAALLAPGGHFVGKIFQGAEFEEARAATAARAVGTVSHPQAGSLAQRELRDLSVRDQAASLIASLTKTLSSGCARLRAQRMIPTGRGAFHA